jgi:hypothetical protein
MQGMHSQTLHMTGRQVHAGHLIAMRDEAVTAWRVDGQSCLKDGGLVMPSDVAPEGGEEVQGTPRTTSAEVALLVDVATEVQLSAGALAAVLLKYGEEAAIGLDRGRVAGYLPEVGEVVRDTARDLVGVVTALDGMLVRLRPEGGGWGWRAMVADVEPASPAEELSTRVADIRARYELRRSR